MEGVTTESRGRGCTRTRGSRGGQYGDNRERKSRGHTIKWGFRGRRRRRRKGKEEVEEEEERRADERKEEESRGGGEEGEKEEKRSVKIREPLSTVHEISRIKKETQKRKEIERLTVSEICFLLFFSSV